MLWTFRMDVIAINRRQEENQGRLPRRGGFVAEC